MKYQAITDHILVIVVSTATMKVLQEIDETIEYNVAMRKTYLYEELMRKHGLYPDKIRNSELCPIAEVLMENLYGSVTLKEYF